MDLVDSHCHLHFPPLAANLEAVLQRASENAVRYMLCVSVKFEDAAELKALARRHRQVYASVGVHPNERQGLEPSEAGLVAAADDPAVIAIGETGLDYYKSQGDMTWQQDRFRRHIRAARECGKPLIIHTRDAAEDTLRILAEEQAGGVGGVMHCFTEDWEVARRALDLNFYISFSGIVTFKNAQSLRAVAARMPEDRLLIETDCPYLAPVPHRGQTNEPAFVRHVATALAEVRQVSLEELAARSTENFFRLFAAARR